MKKLVNVYVDHPFKMNGATFGGLHRELILDTKEIQSLLENKARVEEVLSNGKIIPLGFNNFDEVNGPSNVSENAVDSLYNFKEPEVEIIGKIKKQTYKQVQPTYNLKNKTNTTTITNTQQQEKSKDNKPQKK
nr:MAG TPA: hypothetical protein [Caudoviricetes sp.]